MVNRVILVGTLTRDAEILSGSRGAIAHMRLATSAQWRDDEGNRQAATEFHNLVAMNGRLAEICGTYCRRGVRVYVEGRLRTREYDGSDGLRRTSTDIVIDTMRVLDRHDRCGAADAPLPGGSVAPLPAGSGRPEADAPAAR